MPIINNDVVVASRDEGMSDYEFNQLMNSIADEYVAVKAAVENNSGTVGEQISGLFNEYKDLVYTKRSLRNFLVRFDAIITHCNKYNSDHKPFTKLGGHLEYTVNFENDFNKPFIQCHSQIARDFFAKELIGIVGIDV